MNSIPQQTQTLQLCIANMTGWGIAQPGISRLQSDQKETF